MIAIFALFLALSSALLAIAWAIEGDWFGASIMGLNVGVDVVLCLLARRLWR